MFGGRPIATEVFRAVRVKTIAGEATDQKNFQSILLPQFQRIVAYGKT